MPGIAVMLAQRGAGITGWRPRLPRRFRAPGHLLHQPRWDRWRWRKGWPIAFADSRWSSIPRAFAARSRLANRLVSTGMSLMLPSASFGWRTKIAGLALLAAMTCCSAVISCTTDTGWVRAENGIVDFVQVAPEGRSWGLFFGLVVWLIEKGPQVSPRPSIRSGKRD